MSKNEQKLERPVSVLANGIRIGRTNDSLITVDFLGCMNADDTPKEILGSYVFTVNRAHDFIESLQEAISSADTTAHRQRK